jgi:hypothetical protein
MPLRRLTALIPRPHHLAEVAKRAVDLVPGLPGGGTKPNERAAPPPPPVPVKPVAKPKPAPKPKASKPKAKAPKPPKRKAAPKRKDPHHALNNAVRDPDPTEYPDPYDKREDPRDPPDPDGEPFGEEPHSVPGATSTSAPPLEQDPEAEELREKRNREKLDQ